MEESQRFLMLVLLAIGWLARGDLKAVDEDSFFPSYGPIVGADPAVRKECEVLAPFGFQVARTVDELIVCEGAGPLKPIKLMVGNKMVLGMDTKFYIYREGTARPAMDLWEALGGIQREVSHHASFYSSEPFGFLERGKPYVVELEITIFETDIPGQHMWAPESGKYKVLWKTTLRQTPKEEREFPPEFREIKAQRDRAPKGQPVPLPDIPDEFLHTTSEDWKRILATEITAGFQYSKVSSVLSYLGPKAHANIALKLNSLDRDKEGSIFRGFDHTPLRAALYEICQDTGYTAEWELDHGSQVRILIMDKRK